jgi:hypothetical protein
MFHQGITPNKRKKSCVLVLDEMKIDSGLVWNTSDHKLMGFNDEPQGFQHILDDFFFSRRHDSKMPPIASHVNQ